MQAFKENDDFLNSEELLNALRAGREDAFSYIFNKHYNNLYSYACRILNDENDAQECVQSTFCHIWDVHKTLEIRESLKSYLYRAIYNKAITIIRQKKLIEKYNDKGLSDLYFSRVVQNPQAEIRLNDSETRKVIVNGIDSLPQRCREIFIKCKIQGYSYIEVASTLNLSVKTIENQMTIAIRKLREKLKNFNLF